VEEADLKKKGGGRQLADEEAQKIFNEDLYRKVLEEAKEE
jgi:hypothetical protein